jgi:hypothetical protein
MEILCYFHGMQLPQTIAEVIDHLDLIIQSSLEEENELGYFAALYQKVTIKVKEGIANGRFEDGRRMEQLDVVFANRYIEAYHAYKAKQPLSKSWKLTFDAATHKDKIILQHLLLGMNAHINLDLGIAAAEICPGLQIQSLKNDFVEINTLLFELIDEVQDNLSGVSPLLRNLDFLIKKSDEQFVRFNMKAARQHAWIVAQRMAFVSDADRHQHQRINIINSTDDYVVELGDMISRPGRLVRIGIWLIKFLESKNVNTGIEALRYVDK